MAEGCCRNIDAARTAQGFAQLSGPARNRQRAFSGRFRDSTKGARDCPSRIVFQLQAIAVSNDSNRHQSRFKRGCSIFYQKRLITTHDGPNLESI
jgi:hypothetical protein